MQETITYSQHNTQERETKEEKIWIWDIGSEHAYVRTKKIYNCVCVCRNLFFSVFMKVLPFQVEFKNLNKKKN